MILSRIVLSNVGVFGGRHAIELRPIDSTRPIVLFGGKNGTGKTTILDSVRLCLYGRRSLGARTSLMDYHVHLTDLIHRSPGESSELKRAAISLEFEHTQGGVRTVYRIDRGWELRGNSITEDLMVLSDGHPLESFDQSHWQDFVDTLIPPALSGLFFFDGERVRVLAEDGDNEIEIAGAIQKLLGIDIIDQLKQDLRVYETRLAPESGNDLGNRQRAVSDELVQISQKREELAQSLGELGNRIARQGVAIQRIEDRLVAEGGAFAREREALTARLAQLGKNREDIIEEIHELSAGLLPFAVAPELTRNLAHVITDRATHTETEQRWQASTTIREAIELELAAPDFWKVSGEGVTDEALRRLLAPRLARMLERVTPSQPTMLDAPPGIAMSKADQAHVLHALQQVSQMVAPRAQRLKQQLEAIDEERIRVMTDIQRAPSNDDLREIIEDLGKQHAAMAVLSRERDEKERGRAEIVAQIQTLAKEEADLLDRRAREADSQRREVLTVKVRQALDAFRSRLSERRIAELERALAHSFARLARKPDLVDSVKVDPGTFRVTLCAKDGSEVPRTRLSAGEKQIFAIALLWALAQVSGRRLPVIIDTPLGRLDTDHRAKLVDFYYPFAAEQVILLSTDSEIDQRLFTRLAPSVSRVFHINYSPADKSSVIESGYFQFEDYPGGPVVATPSIGGRLADGK